MILLVVTCIMANDAKAQKPEELLIKANTLYNESAYDSAAAVYESIINKGYSSSTLFYNLGNTYYKIGKYPCVAPQVIISNTPISWKCLN